MPEAKRVRRLVAEPPQVGDLIELIEMPNDGNPVEPGTRGTITRVSEYGDGAWQAGVDWENGRHLGLVEVDIFKVIKDDDDV